MIGLMIEAALKRLPACTRLHCAVPEEAIILKGQYFTLLPLNLSLRSE
jgi:hypothetical protein